MAEPARGLSIGYYAMIMVGLVLLAFLSYGAFTYSECQRVRADMESLLARHSGRPVETVRADTDRALVLAGNEAVAYGVADVVPAASSGGQLEAGRAVTPNAE